MAAFKFVNIVALATLAVLAGSYGPQPVNALSAHGPPHLNRADHHALAQKQRRQDAKKSKRCRKRPSSLTSSAAASTSSAQVTSTDVKASSSEIKTSSSIKATSTAVKTSSSSEVKSSETPKDSPAPQTTPKPTSTKTSSSAQATSTQASSNNNGGSGNNNGGSSNNGGDTGGSNGGGKIGLAWPNGNSPAGWVKENVGWIYSWSVFPPTDYDKFPGLKFIPMLWGADQESDFTKNVHKYSQSGWVASFNEPNQGGQSNLDPTYAASIHKRVIQPLADKGMKVLAPATSSDPRGLKWMQTFMAACDGCKFDAMGIHYYDIKFEGFKTYLNLWYDTFKLPLMVTEFACQDFNGGPQRNQDEVWAFWSDSIKYMESQDWILSYHGFGAMREMQGVNPDNQLMNPSNGQPNALGQTYITKGW